MRCITPCKHSFTEEYLQSPLRIYSRCPLVMRCFHQLINNLRKFGLDLHGSFSFVNKLINHSQKLGLDLDGTFRFVQAPAIRKSQYIERQIYRFLTAGINSLRFLHGGWFHKFINHFRKLSLYPLSMNRFVQGTVKRSVSLVIRLSSKHLQTRIPAYVKLTFFHRLKSNP